MRRRLLENGPKIDITPHIKILQGGNYKRSNNYQIHITLDVKKSLV